MSVSKPINVVFVFSDQQRWCDTGYNGNRQVRTPFLDRLAGESLDFPYAVSGMPVCCPYRATLMTGQYPHRHGVFLNDVCMDTGGPYLAELFRSAGYDTAYIGKWHIDGHGRESYIPPERRRGFDFWQTLECTHDYRHSPYFGDGPEKKWWAGYDAFAQTDCAVEYLRRPHDRPFLLMLSYGPPHNPYETAPQAYQDRYRAQDMLLRPNVPASCAEEARRDLAGYYAHISALDDAAGRLYQTLCERGLEEDTLFVYTSDHGDMLYSHGRIRKQKPWDESIRVPFLLHCPRRFGRAPRRCEQVFASVDVFPTLLGLCGLAVPDTAQGVDFTPYLCGEDPDFRAPDALLSCMQPFGEFMRGDSQPFYGTALYGGGREYRGLRTKRYTYVQDLNGPWLLYDNAADPYQLHNLAGSPDSADLLATLETRLQQRLRETGDEFLPGAAYVERWGYTLDETGTVPIHL